jgi:hypothetical protein
MNCIIIDSVDTRAQKLAQNLRVDFDNVKHIDFISENDRPNNNTLYLIHHSDGYVGEFASNIDALDNSYVVFYSGGGLQSNVLKAHGERIFFYAGVVNTGEEQFLLSAVRKIIEVLKNNISSNVVADINKILGFDAQLEALIHLHKSLKLLPLKSNWSEISFNKEKKALEKLDSIKLAKSKLDNISFNKEIDAYYQQLEPIEIEIINLSI